MAMTKFLEFRYFKYFILAMVLIAVVTAIYTDQAGKKQDAVWLTDYQAYQKALHDLEKGDYEKVLLTLNDLKENYDSSTIYWALGLINSLMDNYVEAENNYQKARELYPAIVLNLHYLKEYSVVLFKNGDYERALKYFERISRETKDGDEKAWSDSYIRHIKDRLDNGGNFNGKEK